jgi:uncharacterized protein
VADASLPTLLVVQEHDSTLDQLLHRRASLPERVALAEAEATVARLDVELAELGERLRDLQRSQRRLEDEVATLEAKAADDDRTLYSGRVTSPKELQALSHEVEALRRRARSLEDDLLEIMEVAEPLAAEVARLEELREGAAEEAERLRGTLRAAEADIDAQAEAVAAERRQAAEGVPEGLKATYEQLRRHLGGIGVARLDGGRCTGCHLSLPAVELDAIRRSPPGTVTHHEECGRILVRTD